MAFGFDPSVILQAANAPKRSLLDALEGTLQSIGNFDSQRTQQRHGEAQLADMMRARGQEETLANIVRANAGTAPGMVPDLMRAGLGKQAMAWQDQAVETGAKEAGIEKLKREAETAYRQHVAALLHGTTEADYPARVQELASSPDQMLAGYAKTMPAKFDPAWVKRTVDAGLSVKEQTDLEEKEKDRQNHTTNARIAAASRPMMLVQGEGGAQGFADPRKPAAPWTPITDREGKPIVKPPTAGGAGSGKEWKDFSEKVSTGARGSLSKDIQKSLNSAEALQTLLQLPDGQLVNATPQQMREAYTALNNLIAKGGSQAVSQIEHLAPETMASKFASAKQYLLNEPQGANAQEFIKNILDTASREAKLAHKQLRRQQLQGIPNYAHLRKTDPARFESILHNAGIDPASIDENGREAAQPSAGGAPVRIKSDADYDALPSGAEFIDPEGKRRRKR